MGTVFITLEDCYGVQRCVPVELPELKERACEDCGKVTVTYYHKCDDCLIAQAVADGLLTP